MRDDWGHRADRAAEQRAANEAHAAEARDRLERWTTARKLRRDGDLMPRPLQVGDRIVVLDYRRRRWATVERALSSGGYGAVWARLDEWHADDQVPPPALYPPAREPPTHARLLYGDDAGEWRYPEDAAVYPPTRVRELNSSPS